MFQDNKKAEKIKEYYIAYFDLLGYKEFFRNHPNEVETFLQDIYKAISHTMDYIQQVNSSPVAADIGKLSIRTKTFSDNILLCLETTSTEVEYPRFLAFLAVVADIQRNFILKYGLFLRGGITIGGLSFNDDFVFGQGLIDAVALEETAIYPRIVLRKTVLDYVLHPHFVKQDDLDRACAIEKRAHSGEHISDEDLAFCNSIMPAINMEKFYLQWRDHLLFPVSDGAVVLNYLYFLNVGDILDQPTISKMLDFLKAFSPNDYLKLNGFRPSQEQWLQQHKARIVQKIREFGRYDDLSTSEAGKADIREHILKKYLWVLTFHNYICETYGLPHYMIRLGSTIDVRFMKMTVEIFEEELHAGTQPKKGELSK